MEPTPADDKPNGLDATPATSTTTDPNAPALKDLLAELSALRQRVVSLEDTDGGSEPKSDVESPRTQSPRAQRTPGRRAQRWVRYSEDMANKRAPERVNFGDGRGFSADDYTIDIVKDGIEHEDTNHEIRYFANRRERDMWSRMGKRPIAGQRLPTSVRPMTKKLGPPNQWDEDNSSQWDSDESTRTRDFDYFQARLRGDFEWEIDRLNMQRQRYADFKRKKQEKIEMRRRREIVNSNGNDALPGDSSNANLPLGKDSYTGLPKIHVMDWASFSSMFYMNRPMFSVIGILEGEPKITTNLAFLKHLIKTQMAPSAPAEKEGKAQVEYTGHAPLPERICIASEELINVLSRVVDADIETMNTDGVVNLVLLRPYRVLYHYSDDIRATRQTLVEEEEKLLAEEAKPDTKDPEGDPSSEKSGSTAAADTPPSGDDATKPPAYAPTSTDAKPDADADSDADAESVSDARSSVVSRQPRTYEKVKKERGDVDCLIAFMENYIDKRVAWLRSGRCEKIHFSDIWHMYKPGDIVISNSGKQAYQVISVDPGEHLGRDPYSEFSRWKDDPRYRYDAETADALLRCALIDYDGTSLGPVIEQFIIKKFDGERLVAAMEILPLRNYRTPDLARKLAGLKDDPATAQSLISEETDKFQKRLIERGRQFVDVAAVKHMYYSGLTVDKRDEVESQVMIDVQEALSEEANYGMRPIFALPGIYELRSHSDINCNLDCCVGQNVYDDSFIQEKEHESFVARKLEDAAGNSATVSNQISQMPVSMVARDLTEVRSEKDLLTDNDLMIMSYSVHGFVLRDRTWARLDMDFVSDLDKKAQAGQATASATATDIVEEEDDDADEDGDGKYDGDNENRSGDKTAFAHLVLPKGHKDMVLSLVSQHFRNKASQKHRDEGMDIVKGKGKGLIILLHGAPGVGKTTTAEGVAEKFNKPLFQITCGDLGSSAKEVEESLQKTFTLASRWDCILLLDEADVFLAARGRNDFTRNGLVAVFLRVLEYYAGILFLTTNRIGDLDEAFTSRIHMTLHYPQLEVLPAVKICRLNLAMIRKRYVDSGRKIKIDKDDIEEHIRDYWRSHVDARWNGRQIRNACQTALALAEYDAQPSNKKYDLAVQVDAQVHLKVDHVRRVSEAYLEFYDYLKGVHGTTTETRAKELGLRAMEIFEDDAFKEAASFRRERMRRDAGGGGRRGGNDGSPLHQFRLSTSSQMPIRQQPQPQQQPQQDPQQQYYRQHQASLSQQMAYQQPQQRQFVPTDQYGQPSIIEPQATTTAAFGSSPQYQTASGGVRTTTTQAYTQGVPQQMGQGMGQPIGQHMGQQPVQVVPRSVLYPGQPQQTNWNTNAGMAGVQEQQYQGSGAYRSEPPTGPPQ